MSKKNQKMSLSAFMADQSLGTWADEVADLPVASAGSVSFESKTTDSKWGRNAQLPSAPPYLLYMGNMDFNVTERDLNMFFGDLEIKSIRIIKDANENPKGFGYIEFEDLQGLKDALLLNNESLLGRKVRLDVAERKFLGIIVESSEGKRTDRTAESTNWRREGGPVDISGSKLGKYDKTENVSNWRREGPPPEIKSDRQGRDQRSFRQDSTNGVSNWRREGPPPEIKSDRQGREERAYRQDSAADGVSNWRRDGPPPEIKSDRPGREQRGFRRDATDNASSRRREGPPPERKSHSPDYADQKPFRNTKAESESSWRRDGPPPEINRNKEGSGYKRQDNRSAGKPSEGEGQARVVKDKTDNVSSWRREAPLEEKNGTTGVSYKKSNKFDKGKQETSDSWRSSNNARLPTSNGFPILKHDRSTASIKNVKVSRTDDEDTTESSGKVNTPKASVTINNAFGCLSTAD